MQRITAPVLPSTARRGRWEVLNDLRPGTDDAIRVNLAQEGITLKALKRLRDRQKAAGTPITVRQEIPGVYIIHRVHPSTSK